jgi:hypothetical protein
VSVEFRHIKGNETNKYQTSSDCYRAASRLAALSDAAALFLIPDMVFGDGGIRSIARILDSGYRAVMVMGLRAVKETLVPEVRQRFEADGRLCAPPRELVALAGRHLHPVMAAHFVDGTSRGFHPSLFCWRVGADGFLVRSFHLHPVAVCPREHGVSFSRTIDDDLVESSSLSAAEVYVIADSDEVLWFEVSDRAYSYPVQTARTVRSVARWMMGFTTELNRAMLRHSIRIHAGPADGPAWEEAEERSRLVVEKLLAAYSSRAQYASDSIGGWRKWLIQLQLRAEGYLSMPGVLRQQFPRSVPKLIAAMGIVTAFNAAQFIRAPLRKSKEWARDRL